MIFGRCQCRHIPIPLPDADPYDKWDEELEEGDTILAISFEEAIRIRASRHVANYLAAEAMQKRRLNIRRDGSRMVSRLQRLIR